jgi:hypothetical protein
MNTGIEITELGKKPKYAPITPKPGMFYFIDYIDPVQPKGSYFGIAKCINVCDSDEEGERIIPPLYEFIHPTADGEMVSSLFYAAEVVMATGSP